jgi:hypothetical protein
MLAQVKIANEKDKVTIVEHLFWYSSGNGEFHKIVFDDPSHQSFESEPFLTFSVPPSPKSSVIFFELGIHTRVTQWWEGYFNRFFCGPRLRIYSELLPNDIEITTGINLEEVIYSPETLGGGADKNNWKIILRKDGLLREFPDWWWVRYKSTGEPVPNEMANSILNGIIDNGFNVEFYLAGEVWSVKGLMNYLFYIEVTRLSKQEK